MRECGISGRESVAGFRALLKCPNCLEADTLALNASPALCVQCGASFSTRGDILDFVAGRDNTALDVLAYDQEKNVSFGASLQIFGHLKRVAGDLLPTSLGEILEIGAGTGLFTLGMLASNDFDWAVITDVSPEMLGVCRARLEENIGAEKFSRILLATYSGREKIFAEGAYDLCTAYSVVHHILDYRAFFADVRMALKPTGTALFVEPSGPFHVALTLAINDALICLLAEGAGTASADVKKLASWLAETRSRLMFPDTGMATREDKHLFWRSELECEAQGAGFADLTVLPWHFDPLGLLTLNDYAGGIGLSHEFREVFIPTYRKVAEYHFRHVAEKDMSSMYVIGLHCSR